MNPTNRVELGDLSFVSTGASQNDVYSGTMENSEVGPETNRHGFRQTDSGLASQLINNRGFGWLTEIEEIDDEAHDKPLL